MDKLFAPVRPAAGFENRVVENLRAARPRRRVFWSRGMRIAAGVAALVMLGTMGAVLHWFMATGNLAFPGMESGEIKMAQAVTDDRDLSFLERYMVRVQGSMAPNSASPSPNWGKINSNTLSDGELLDALIPNGRTDLFARDNLADLSDGLEIRQGLKESAEHKLDDLETKFYQKQVGLVESSTPALAADGRSLGRVQTSIDGGIIGGNEKRELALTLENASAGDVATALNTFAQLKVYTNSNQMTGFQEIMKDVTITPDNKSNVVIIRGTDPQIIDTVTKLARELDVKPTLDESLDKARKLGEYSFRAGVPNSNTGMALPEVTYFAPASPVTASEPRGAGQAKGRY